MDTNAVVIIQRGEGFQNLLEVIRLKKTLPCQEDVLVPK